MTTFSLSYRKQTVRRLKRPLIILFTLTVLLNFSFVVIAVDVGYGGPAPSTENADLMNSVTIWAPGGPRMSTQDIERLYQLADRGVKIIYSIIWWNEPGTSGYNALDMYYNETFRSQVMQIIDYNFDGKVPDFYPSNVDLSWDGLDPSKLWAVTLGDEEPGCYRDTNYHDALSEDIARFSEIYYSETGYQLKPLIQMNRTEETVFYEWFREKNVWAYNYIYVYIKSKWPNLLVFQYTFMEPVWGVTEIVPTYELKADGYMIDCYYAYEDPWLLYETVRRYKATFPDKPFFIILWGTIWDFYNEPGDKLYYKIGSFEDIRREAWLAYLAGSDGIFWFNWAPQNKSGYDWRWGYERIDVFGKQIIGYTNRLNRELMKLPVFKPRPQVLALGDGVQTGQAMPNFADIGLFSEFDAINERALAKTDLDLSKYKIIVCINNRYHDETVQKLNEFVANGGNLVFLGGFGSQKNYYDNSTRDFVFPLEKDTAQVELEGHVRINVTRPNLLNLELNFDGCFFKSSVIRLNATGDDYHPIGDFFLIENGNATEITDFPLLLYHNASNPNSGWVLYWGASAASQVPGATWENYNYENQTDLWYLYQVVFRAFAKFLNVSNSISIANNENILATQSIFDSNSLLVGISNIDFHKNCSFNYSFNLSPFGFSPGSYYLYSLDTNETLGGITSDGGILSFPVEVISNGTRLFLVSKTSTPPNFSVNIYPPNPTEEEVSDGKEYDLATEWYNPVFVTGIIVLILLFIMKKKQWLKKDKLRSQH